MEKRTIFCGFLVSVLLIMGITNITSINSSLMSQDSIRSSQETFSTPLPIDPAPLSSDGEVVGYLEDIFVSKKAQYDTSNYFSQFFESSLMSTYHALYILNALGKLDQINQTAVLNFIMKYYNNTSHTFMDAYAYRYLDTDFIQTYYSLNTILETTCYAILSLKILNRFDLINIFGTKIFIRSCFHPDTGGFMGRPYDPSLNSYFLIATMDNTYYAVLTLQALGDDWTGYSTEKVKLVAYIQSLQNAYGGFSNDKDSLFRSMGLFEPNLLSCYYCVKTLDIFELKSTIRISDLQQYLQNQYDSSEPCFWIDFVHDDYMEIVATALGLQISDLMGYSTFNRDGLITFLLNNRNSWGIWDNSRAYKYHELMDTFEILRALIETNCLSYLTSTDKDNIVSALKIYYQQSDHGFSPLSTDYTSLELIHTVISSCALFERIASDMGPHLQTLYEQIEAIYKYFNYPGRSEYAFFACININPECWGFRSYPIEFCTTSYHLYTPRFDNIYCHKNTFFALDTLEKLYKLDDFAFEHSLQELLNDIIECQFLNNSHYNYYGGFLPNQYSLLFPATFQIKNIHFEYAYYAIKAMEVIAKFLELGNITNLPFNKYALYNYIVKDVIETPSLIYYKPQNTDCTEETLKQTYFMIYLLKAINLYDLKKEKLRNLVLQSLDYGNIENIYYCFKIAEILNLDVEFNIERTSNLINTLYSEKYKEFRLKNDSSIIDQEVFLWICDMAINDAFRIDCSYQKTLYLGGINNIAISLSNLVFNKYDRYFSLRFESKWFGVIPLEKYYDNTYRVSFYIPDDPYYYPVIIGDLKIYYKEKFLDSLRIVFQTIYDLSISNITDEIFGFTHVDFKVSYNFSTGLTPAYKTRIYATFHQNSSSIIENFSRKDFSDYSLFSLEYNTSKYAGHKVNITLIDNFHPKGLSLYNSTIAQEHNSLPDPSPPKPTSSPNNSPDSEEPLDIAWLLSVIVTILIGFTSAVIITYAIKKRKKDSSQKHKSSKKYNKFIDKLREKASLKHSEKERDLNLLYHNYASNNSADKQDLGPSSKLSESPVQTSVSEQPNDKLDYTYANTTIISENLIDFLQKNKKSILWIIIGTIGTILMYIFSTYLIPVFIYGGILFVILGIILYFSDKTKWKKILCFGALLIVLGFYTVALLIIGKLINVIVGIF